MLRFFGPILAAIILSSCAAYTLVKGGGRVEIGNGLSTSPTLDWNKISDGDVDVWTLDGAMLQQIIFIKGADDGDYLIPVRKMGSLAIDENIPKIEKGMTSIEVVELFEATFAQMKAQKLKVNKIQPYETEFTKGFRFDFTFFTVDGLEKIGSSYGVLKDNKLYMAIYSGTKLHYYERGIQDFEEIIRSMKIS